MKVTADLHIHSRFSRATSKTLNPASLERWARIKGIDLLGTGDCTHPAWLAELRDQLVEAEEGFFTLKKEFRSRFDAGNADALPDTDRKTVPRFVLTGEISTIYKWGERTRKVHHLVILPDFQAAQAFQARLERVGNISSDGRPILGIDSRDLLRLLVDTDERGVLVPAHIWTPWFSALGAKSGFDTIDECYRDFSHLIPAVETGLSSNPPMNWALSSLDRFSIISNSDAHSAENLGREATAFEMDMSFSSLSDALRLKKTRTETPLSSIKQNASILYTVEFYPQEGKYHYDGHRKCGVCKKPEEVSDGRCPVCGKALTMGVMRRVLELADRSPIDEWAVCPADWEGTNRRPYLPLIPLRELTAELLGTGAGSKKVDAAYKALIREAGSELTLLIDTPVSEAANMKVPGIPGERLAQALTRMRRGEVFIQAGYDGEYGVIHVFPGGENTSCGPQNLLFETQERGAAVQSEFPMAGRERHEQRRQSAQNETEAASKHAIKAGHFSPDGEQEAAINYEGSHALVVAGPGTGKTAVLCARIARLIQAGAEASNILALSFTVKAARELAVRAAPRDGNDYAITTATFHSLCAAILREKNSAFTILDDQKRDSILKELCAGEKISARSLGLYIEERKRFLLSPGQAKPVLGADNASIALVAESIGLPERDEKKDALYRKYQERLRRAGETRLLDFDDLIAEIVWLFASSPTESAHYAERYRYIFVDEYQDINFAQYALIRLLTRAGDNGASQKLFVIGDPNQSIYAFRGSDKRFIDRFLTDYPDAACFYLKRSFRCAAPIINAASALVNAPLHGEGEGGEVALFRAEYPSDKSEAEGIARRIAALVGGASFFALDSGTVDPAAREVPLDAIAVLLRASSLAPPLLKALADHGLPCKLTETAKRGEEEPDIKTDGVRVMTIHASKGLEFEHVFVPALEEGLLPFTLYTEKDDRPVLEAHIEEEQRLLYVAMTRAKTGLYLSWTKQRLFQGRLLENRPSRFLARLETLIPLSRAENHRRRRAHNDTQAELF